MIFNRETSSLIVDFIDNWIPLAICVAAIVVAGKF